MSQGGGGRAARRRTKPGLGVAFPPAGGGRNGSGWRQQLAKQCSARVRACWASLCFPSRVEDAFSGVPLRVRTTKPNGNRRLFCAPCGHPAGIDVQCVSARMRIACGWQYMCWPVGAVNQLGTVASMCHITSHELAIVTGVAQIPGECFHRLLSSPAHDAHAAKGLRQTHRLEKPAV